MFPYLILNLHLIRQVQNRIIFRGQRQNLRVGIPLCFKISGALPSQITQCFLNVYSGYMNCTLIEGLKLTPRKKQNYICATWTVNWNYRLKYNSVNDTLIFLMSKFPPAFRIMDYVGWQDLCGLHSFYNFPDSLLSIFCVDTLVGNWGVLKQDLYLFTKFAF